MSDTKPSNPKDAFGSAKAPLGLVPDTVTADVSMAFLEGALKYGRYNWRVAGVRASIYNDAMERHRAKWWNGESRDPLTRVKHLANLVACAAIVLDSEICGMLEDDRPPAMPMGDYLDSLQAHIKHLKELFKDHTPPQYTQREFPREQTSIPPGCTYEDIYAETARRVLGVAYVPVLPDEVRMVTDVSVGDLKADETAFSVPEGWVRTEPMLCELPSGHPGLCYRRPVPTAESRWPNGTYVHGVLQAERVRIEDLSADGTASKPEGVCLDLQCKLRSDHSGPCVPF